MGVVPWLLGKAPAGIIGRRWPVGNTEARPGVAGGKALATQTLALVRSKVTRERVTAFLVEMAIVTGLMVIYFYIRGDLPEPVPQAVARSTKIIHLEQALGIFVEPGWQEPVLKNKLVMQIANGIYIWGHFPVILAAALWLYWKNRQRYGLYRTGLVLSAFIGLWGYAFFPAAPPRLMPGQWGFVDTIALVAKGRYEVKPDLFLNHYAAVPSLHFGWSLLVGIAIWENSRNLLFRAFAVLMPAAMFWAIVVTANHFIFDMLMGAAIVLVALFISWLYYTDRLPMSRVFRRLPAVRS
jgi:hypothetical protein